MTADEIAGLVLAVADGDRNAETLLVNHYSRGLKLMLIQRTGDPALADDLHQEAFMTVLQRIRSEKLDNPEQFRAFLWATANNLFINEYRKNQRRNTQADSEIFDVIADSESKTQLDLMEEQETAEMVHQLIQELPVERDRELLQRFYVREQEKVLICQELELDSHHFDRVLYRAKQRLKQIVSTRML